MTFQEFRQAVREIADGDFYNVGIELTDYGDGGRAMPAKVVWTAYTHRHRLLSAATPEAVLAQMRGATDVDVEQIGEVA